jgi:hypothetical protein
MEINYYEKYLKYKTKYLELKAQLGGNEYENLESGDRNEQQKPVKDLRLCHLLNEDKCIEKNGCARDLEKGTFRYLGCKQKHCWGRTKSFCENAGLQGKNGSIWGTSGCEYKDKGCRMKCDHIRDDQDCNKLNECQWENNSCVPKENPCRSIQKDKTLKFYEKKTQCNSVKDGDGKNLCKVELFSRRCVPKS